MSEVTPGPWKLVGTGLTVWSASNDMVASTLTGRQNDRANAQLVAAAPELLAACATVLDALEFHYPSMHHSICPWTTGVLRSAIAKATGKENSLPVSKEGA